jgi:O-antigen ligase
MMGVAVLAVTVWPAAAILWTWGAKARIGAVALIAASLATCLLSEKSGQIYGSLLGVLFFAATLAWGHNALRTAAYSVASWLVAFPFLVGPLRAAIGNHHLPLSWAIRLDIWAEAVKRIPASPIIGRGIGSYRSLTMPMPTVDGLVQPTHPHSTSLQIWFELGAVGVLLAAGAIILLAEKAARTPSLGKPVLAGAAGALMAGAVIANVSYGLWEEWWLATLFLAGGMVAATNRTA